MKLGSLFVLGLVVASAECSAFVSYNRPNQDGVTLSGCITMRENLANGNQTEFRMPVSVFRRLMLDRGHNPQSVDRLIHQIGTPQLEAHLPPAALLMAAEAVLRIPPPPPRRF